MYKHILILQCIGNILLYLRVCESYQILVVFGFPGKSHSILGEELVKLLLKDGHQVTYIAAGNYSGPRENLSLIDLSDTDTLKVDNMLSIENIMNNLKNVNINNQKKILTTTRIFNYWNRTIQHMKVQKFLLDSSLRFDAVIVEWLYTEIGSGFAAIYQCPLIWFSSMEPDWGVLSLIDEMPNPAYSIDISTDLVPPLNFLQRVQQLWVLTYTNVILSTMRTSQEESFVKAFSLAAKIRGIKLPSLQQMKFNGSLMLGNSNAVISGLLKIPQNYKHVGGYHIDDNPKLLPDNIHKRLNNSNNGFIYFSMGTMLKTWNMPEKTKKDLMHMFGSLNYTVLWKLDEDEPNLPPNVISVKWVPQQSILAHPNIKIFITHGGLLSLIEAVHFGVPLIGIPGFADQQLNIQKASNNGFCVRVDLSYELAINLKLAIEEVLGNPAYKTTIKNFSRIYHDRIVTPRQAIPFWVKHVIDSNGAEYLRSPAFMVPWYQKFYLDLALLIFLKIVLISFILRLVCKKIFRKSQKMKKD